jgi:hypothetical protein
MWARTDAGGRAWLHPDAFDPRARQLRGAGAQGRPAGLAAGSRAARRAPSKWCWTRGRAGAARLDLVFLVDATGSMADEIDKLKATLRTITAEVAQPAQPPRHLPGPGGLPRPRRRLPAAQPRLHQRRRRLPARRAVPLQAAGGGDYPEAMNEALHETVHQLSWRGAAPPAGGAAGRRAAAPGLRRPQYDDDMLAALGKGIKVFGVGASGLDKQGEFIQRQIAQYTGGKFVFLTYQDARRPGSGPGRETVHDVRTTRWTRWTG